MNKVSNIPKLIYTALSEEDALAQIKKISEAEEVIKKPISKKNLSDLLKKYLDI